MVKNNNTTSLPEQTLTAADLSTLYSISETIKEQIGSKSKILEIDKTALNISRKITEAAQSQNKGLESREKLEKQISKNQKLQERAALLAKSYTQDLFGTHKTNYELALKLHKENIADLATIQQMQDTAEETGELDKKGLTALYDKVAGREKELKTMDKSIAKSAQIAIQTQLAANELNKETIAREKELALLIEIEKSMGIIGKITGALGELPVVGKAFTDSFTAAQVRMKAITEETGKVPGGLQAAKIQLQELSNIAQGAFLAAVVKQALELDKNLNNVQRATGQTEAQVHGLNYALQGASAASGNMYITSNDMLKTFGEITKQIGMSAEVLGVEAVVEATALKDQMGLSAEAAGNFAAQSRISGKDVKGAGEEVFGTVNQFNKLNKSAVSASEVLEAVGTTSKDIGAQFGFNTTKLAQAVTVAKSLGLELTDLNSIADKLTDFQSSIESELEAELLTGQQLNLEKARELALTNDLAGLGKELANQGITAEKFSKMNRIQQEATANALGMSSDQMGKMLFKQELANIGAEKFEAKYGEQNYEATKQVDIQERLQKALAKIVDLVSPIVAFFADILSHASVLYSVLGVLLFSKLKAIGSFFSGMKDNLKESASFGKQILKSIAGIFSKKDKGGTDIGKTITNKLSDKQTAAGFGGKKAKDELLASQGGGPPPVTTTAAPAPSLGKKLGETGEGAGKGLTGLAKGLTAMGTGTVLFGALNLIPTAVGLLTMVVGIPALYAIAATGAGAGAGLTGLAIGLTAMGTGAVLFGALNLIPTAVGLAVMLAGIPAMLVLAIPGLGAAFALNMLGIATGLTTLGAAALTGIPFLGIALIAAFGLAMIPFGIALGFAAPAIEAFGNIIIGVLGAVPPIITAIANGFVTMFSAITNNLSSILLLGPALLGIAVGLAAVAFAGLAAMPVLGALIALGAVGVGLTALAGIFGGDEDEAKKPGAEETSGEMAEVVALLKELIAAVKVEGKVLLDGQAVGKALALNSYSTGK